MQPEFLELMSGECEKVSREFPRGENVCVLVQRP